MIKFNFKVNSNLTLQDLQAFQDLCIYIKKNFVFKLSNAVKSLYKSINHIVSKKKKISIIFFNLSRTVSLTFDI